MSSRGIVLTAFALAVGFARAACCAATDDVAAEEKIQKRLRSWDKYEKEWTASSDIVVLAKYRRGKHP